MAKQAAYGLQQADNHFPLSLPLDTGLYRGTSFPGSLSYGNEVDQGSQIRQIWHILCQNCSDDSTEVMEGVALTPEILGNKQGATSTPEIYSNTHSFVLTFLATNTIILR